jgi:regulator of replication initiation timing
MENDAMNGLIGLDMRLLPKLQELHEQYTDTIREYKIALEDNAELRTENRQLRKIVGETITLISAMMREDNTTTIKQLNQIMEDLQKL